MYLKSLTLKGFKSFADKTAMLFDPGLTVVVGPNGSGKSNVSDAILWVLGEQSAKQLRGSAMEDVIFAGSSARSAVALAEVTLVLDNSDHTLALDFAEVAITRRMYRSGESEYLINGSPSRLRDIQDILHDTGLGKETHSIISQGKLDSILSSRPEERRKLIEEAADISKHRRRKERSERKLSSMDENLARAKIIAREISRQLRPLERQVDRYQRASEIQSRAHELDTILAVDDLRALQEQDSALRAKENELLAECEIAEYQLGEKAAELEKLQNLLEEKGLFVGDLGEQRRRMQNILGRMDADMRLLEEKGKNMVGRLSEMRMTLSTMEKQKRDVASEKEQRTQELKDYELRLDEQKRELARLEENARVASEGLREHDERDAQLKEELKKLREEADAHTLAYAKLEEQLSSAEVEDKMFASRLSQIDETIESARDARLSCDERLAELANRLTTVERELVDDEKRVEELDEEFRQARLRVQDTREELDTSRTTLNALQSVVQDIEQASPLARELAQRTSGAHRRLSDILHVREELEVLIEQLFGEDLNAFVLDDAQALQKMAKHASSLHEEGAATLMALNPAAKKAQKSSFGKALLDFVDLDDKTTSAALSALMENIFVVDSIDEALRAHEHEPEFCYVVQDGSSVLPDGRVCLGKSAGEGVGSLERKRRIATLSANIPLLEESYDALQKEESSYEQSLSSARAAHASHKLELSQLQAERDSLTADKARLEAQLSSAEREREQVTGERKETLSHAQAAKDEVEMRRNAARDARSALERLNKEADALAAERARALERESYAARELSEMRLEIAMSKERLENTATRLSELESRLLELDERAAATRSSASALEVVRLRVGPLYERYEAIQTSAHLWADKLRDRASLAEADSDSLKSTIAEARTAQGAAQEKLDRARARVAELKVDLGRMELQVQTAVEAIQASGAVLEEALLLEEPSDRVALEREQARLKRQLEEIGPINEVALSEYESLKERADHIDEQVADLEAARASLKKITAAIEKKMRARFLGAFELVNENFSQVFAMLFPGGSAQLELTDPDHLDETGVEVIAQPRGKKLSKMMLMSGGEKSLTALALLFATYRARTVPFYVFDEVEAALDDANLSKLLDAIDQLKEDTQLIVISHQRRTMEQADVLYGVSMQADGVSHVVSQRLDRTSGKVVDA